MDWFRRLAAVFRPAADVSSVLRPIDGSAAYPAPPSLMVPEDLRRAIDEENLRLSAEQADGESDAP